MTEKKTTKFVHNYNKHILLFEIYANYVRHTVLLLYYVYDNDCTVGLLAVCVLLCPRISVLA